MKAGDLVKWDYAEGMAKTGVLLRKESTKHGSRDYYWRVFIHGEAVLMGEEYLKVIHESR